MSIYNFISSGKSRDTFLNIPIIYSRPCTSLYRGYYFFYNDKMVLWESVFYNDAKWDITSLTEQWLKNVPIVRTDTYRTVCIQIMQKTRQMYILSAHHISFSFFQLYCTNKTYSKLSYYWWENINKTKVVSPPPSRTHSAYIVKNTCCWGSRKVLLDQCHGGLFGRGGGGGTQ